MPKRHLIAALAVVGLLLPLAVVTASPASTKPSITFGSATVVDPLHAFGEPNVRIGPEGNVHVSGPWGTGTQRSYWERSTDGGRTFFPLHRTPASSTNDSVSTIPGPGGGDTEISIDHTGKVYYADLAALASLKVATWDERTKTMKSDVFLKGKQNLDGYDRQWFALWDPSDPAAVRRATGYKGPLPVNYLTYTEAIAASNCDEVEVQLNGKGCDSAAYSTDGIDYVGPTASFLKANDGSIVIDQDTGTVLQAISVDSQNDVGIAIRTRDPSKPSDPALTKARIVKAATLPENMTTRALFTVNAIDQARTAYLIWVTASADETAATNKDAWQIWYSYATAASQWSKWSKPLKVSSPPARTAVMPWAVAGSKGRLAIVWYGTDDAKDDPQFGDSHQAWDVYLATLTAADTANPHIEQQKVTRHPMHYGTICLSGTACIAQQGNRNLADFFEVTIDPRNGALAIVYNDTSNELVQTIPGTDIPIPEPIDGIADHRGAPVVMLLRQNGGIGLYGKPIAGPAAFGAGALSGAKGNARFDPVYAKDEVPGLDARSVTLSRDGDDLVFRMAITSLDDPTGTLSITGAQALNYIVRWVGEPIDSPTGTRNPIYYAAVEVGDGDPTFFAGTARSVDLCSVSGCFPHTIEYPAPPLGGSTVTGRLIQGSGTTPDSWEIRVPRNVVGGPTDTSVLESFSAFTIARNKSASLPMTNLEEELGISPIVVDALCCVDTSISASNRRVLGAKTTRPATKPGGKGSTGKGGLAATGVPTPPVALVVALLVCAALTFRATRRA